jgi:vacuolar-type H+-ATPase subunit E/Vma4
MPKPAQVVTTDAEIDEAIERARKYAKYDRRVVNAAYSKATDRLRLILDDGASYTLPRSLIQGLAGAEEKKLKRIQILSDGTGLLWPLLDVAHYVPGLLGGVYGSEKWMAALYEQRKKLKLVDTTGHRRHQ